MIYGKVTTFYTIYDIFVRLKYVIYLQLIILRLWNFFSYFWKPIVYYNFWKLTLHLITLQIYCLIELIRILVTYWVVNSPPFSHPISDCEEEQILEVLMLCCEQEKKLSDFGIGWSSNSFSFIFISQLALCTWGLDFVPIKLLENYS